MFLKHHNVLVTRLTVLSAKDIRIWGSVEREKNETWKITERDALGKKRKY